MNGRSVLFKIVNIKDKVLDYNTLNKISTSVKKLNYPYIFLELNSIHLRDKLSIELLEKSIFDLIINTNKTIVISAIVNPNNINTELMKVSPLLYLGVKNYRNGNYSKKLFLKLYKFDISKISDYGVYHYRRFVYKDKVDNSYYAKIISDLNTTLPGFIPIKEKQSIAELVCELVENSITHGNSNCLFDIDVTTNHYKKYKNSDDSYFGVNIGVINESENLFFTKLKNKIKNMSINNNFNSSRYKYVYDSYYQQQEYFNDDYNENNFWSLANLQDRISGRGDYVDAGGKGLTKLINTLQTSYETEDSDCYILSGNILLKLKQEHLKYDKNKWLGFNDKNDFMELPDKDIFEKNNFYFKGTAYNISFSMKG